MSIDPQSITGWMAPECLEWLAKMGKKVSVMAEAGCWKGRSTAALMSRGVGTLYAIDTWEGTPDRPVQQARYFPDAGVAAYDEFCTNMAEYIESGRLKVCKMTSITGAAFLRNNLGKPCLDFCFIDADHAYKAVKADLRAYAPLVRKGCILAGHDFTHDGVNKAVREVFKGVKIYRGPGSIWYIYR